MRLDNLLNIAIYGIIKVVFYEIIYNVYRRKNYEKFEEEDKR